MDMNILPEIKQVIPAESWPKGHVARVVSVRRSSINTESRSIESIAL